MAATIATIHNTMATHCSDSDSDDDSDVAFAYMDFDGVAFEDDDAPTQEENCNEINDKVPLAEESTSDIPTKDDCKQELEEQTAKQFELNTPSEEVEEQTHNVLQSDTNDQTTYASTEQYQRSKVLSSIIFPDIQQLHLNDVDKKLLAIEKDILLPRSEKDTTATLKDYNDDNVEQVRQVKQLIDLLENGKYAEILQSEVAMNIFGSIGSSNNEDVEQYSMIEQIKIAILKQFSIDDSNIVKKCIELQVIGIASLNLFLQLNYTGPSLDRGLKPEEEVEDNDVEEGMRRLHPLDGINPHKMFDSLASRKDDTTSITASTTLLVSPSATLTSISEDGASTTNDETTPTSHVVHSLKETNTTNDFHNTVLSELTTDGEWPYQVCIAPYFLLLGRCILSLLAEPTRPFRIWSTLTDDDSGDDKSGSVEVENTIGISEDCGSTFVTGAQSLSTVKLWNARAVVAHRRLISTRHDDDDEQACPTLWNEAKTMFSRCISDFCDSKDEVLFNEDRNAYIASEVMLEWGLCQHHFRRCGRGKDSFNKSLTLSKLQVEVTGAEGKRTKHQQKATAQYLVRAKPSSQSEQSSSTSKGDENIEKQMIKHVDVDEDAILLEKIKFEDEDDNEHYNLSIHEQSILLALCLDVKNDNPMDGLTGEQMGAFLARVLNQHDDWMVYSTALLERAWLECERVHGRERAILQIQALADQHSNRLTLTQSTFKSVEEDSAPAQDRLRNLHGIVYPPRWDMLRDLAERYAKLGVVTSGAELFEEIELWDEVVECYRLAGKENKAIEIVRARLVERETPQMHAALGDLTKDPSCFERALELSNGKYYDAHVALGKFYFDKGDLRRALKHFLEGLEIKPLMPQVWFRVGTISMQLKEWDTALRAFTEVVQQEPEEGDAWGNVAAIHMHKRNPAEAYPALIEVSYSILFVATYRVYDV